MTNLIIEEKIDQLIQEMGDICHESYTGCVKDSGDWEYCYKNEVVNLLDDPRIKQQLLSLIQEEKKKELEAIIKLPGHYSARDYDLHCHLRLQALKQPKGGTK